MKRRDLLKGGAAMIVVGTGCERNGDSKAKAPKSGPAPSGSSSDIGISRLMPQQEPCPFVFSGEKLARLDGNQLWIANAPNWKPKAVSTLKSAHSLGSLGIDGGFVVVENTPQQRLVVVQPGKSESYFSGFVDLTLRKRSRVFDRGNPGEIVIATAASKAPVVARVVFANDEFDEKETFSLRLGNDFDTLTMLVDGSFLYANSAGINQVGFGQSTVVYKAEAKSKAEANTRIETSAINHLVAGPAAKTVWASIGSRGHAFLETQENLVLLSLAHPVTILTAVKKPGWVYHLAPAGHGGVVALVVAQSAGWVTSAQVVVFDKEAREQWRVDVAAPYIGEGKPWIDHWVAGSSNHVAVGTTDSVTIFDIHTGNQLFNG